MNLVRSTAPALTDFEAARAVLLDGLSMVAPAAVPLDEALGAVCAEAHASATGWPASDIAAIDGFAFASADLAGASAYAPAITSTRPQWVDVGDPLPGGCDCVLEAPCVDADGPLVEVLCEAVPGQGVRRAGEDIAAGRVLLQPGRRVTALDLLAARRSGLERLAVRRPSLAIIDVAASDGGQFSSPLVADLAAQAGSEVAQRLTVERDSPAIVTALGAASCDLIITVGGTGDGRTDAAAEAIASCGTLLAHGLAIRPGQRMAIGRIGQTPVISLPGMPDQALGGWLLMAEPLIHHLTGLEERSAVNGRLSRKISSAIGFCEIVLLARDGEDLSPLATGAFSLAQVASAEAWLAVPADSEGYAAGATANAWPLRDTP